MRLSLTLFSFCCVLWLAGLPAATTALAQAPAWQWGLQTTNPTPTDASRAVGQAVATDAAGNVYVGGTFARRTGGMPTVTRQFGNAATLGPTDAGFVAQVTPAGQWAWVTPITVDNPTVAASPRDQVTDIAVTAAGDVYVSGIVFGTALHVGTQTQALPASGFAAYVARLNSRGVCQWVQVVETRATAADLAHDPSTGGIVLGGVYGGTPSFGSTTLPTSASSSPNSLFVARLSPAGQWLSALAVPLTGSIQLPLTVAVGPLGQVAVTGIFRNGFITFGATTLITPTSNQNCLFVAQLSPANQWQWAVQSTGAPTYVFGGAYTAGGALWFTGRGENGSVLGSTTLQGPMTGSSAAFVGFAGQLSATGQWGTVQQLAPSAAGLVAFGPLAVDAAGNLLCLGGLRGDAGPVTTTLGTQLLTSPGTGLLFFVAALNSAGQWRHVASVPRPAQSDGVTFNSIALDSGGHLYLAGALAGGLSIGSSTLLGSTYSGNVGTSSADVLLARLSNATVLAARPGAAAPTLACYPNPAHGTATLRRPAGPARPVELLDNLGRTVRSFPAPADATVTLDLRGLAPGFYLVRCGPATARLVVE